MKNKIYNHILDEEDIKRPIVKNSIKAYLVGGFICLFGELLIFLFTKVFKVEKSTAQILMSMTIVTITCILTGIGIFDKIGEVSGTGTIIPITGFANSLTSSALESKSEGIITGILTNMFKLAGAIIVTAIVSSFLVATIIYLIRV